MTFTKILCPTDFSPGAEVSLRFAARIAKETGAELVVAHAWYVPATAYSLEAPFPGYVVQQLADDAQRGLDAATEMARAAGAKRVTSKLLDGVPWAAIVGLLDEDFDLCVIGTHGRTGISRILLGSVTEKVVRHAPCSVLVVRPESELKPFMHVLVPTDFSKDASAALALASKLVAPKGHITLMHVIEIPVAYSGEVSMADFARDLDTRATAALDGAARELRALTSVPVMTKTRIGYPGAQNLAALEADPTIDLVVMGSHGRTGIARVLMGSVAEKVVRHSHSPVLVARKRS